jgi:protein-S-isoprenylcysteine O-methyltransferase Ste14
MTNEETLVTHGVYRISRNPMYLGFLLFLIGTGFFVANISALLLIMIFVLYMNRFQIEPEEKHLENSFGQTYIDYKTRVRRWI